MKLKIYLVKLINLYQKYVSPLLGDRCKFYPTCSEYSKQAIEKYGVFRGVGMGFWRVLRCHPWQKHQIDPLI
ncbi:MAG: membrane protein insertion efficiency factor YidD [Candidatus Pacebacteria bacterium]|nr:membrane protein insertion efficiency factor YidD [Candidatus Paceibacterota bacterium]